MAAEDTQVSGMAGRYALALFELASESNSTDAVEKALDAFQALIDESEDLRRLVRSPVFSAEDQLKAVSALTAKADIGGIAANLLKVVASNRRLFAVSSIIRDFKILVARSRGEISAQVTVAEAMSAAQESALVAALKEALGKEPKIAVKVDPAILGGLIVKVGSKMVDSSLKTKLNSIKTAMKEVG